MTTKEMSDFINSLWCWSRCTEEEKCKLSEIADYLSNRGNEKSALDNVRAEIERQEKWLTIAGYNTYNVDIALDAIKAMVAESEG